MGWLDKIPASVRHSLIVLLAAVLTTLSQVFAGHQGGDDLTLSDVLWGLGAAVVTQLILVITPLTQQYGVGAPAKQVVIGDGTPPVEGEEPSP